MENQRRSNASVNDIAGEASIIIVEAVEHIRAVYDLWLQTLAPAVVIIEDLDLMTKSRQNPYAYAAVSKDDVTGECCKYCLVAPLTPTSSRSPPQITLKPSTKRWQSGPDASTRTFGWAIQPTPTSSGILNLLLLDRFGVSDDITRRRLQQTLRVNT